MFASFWIYHYVDLDDHELAHDEAEPNEEADADMLREYDRLGLN